MYAQILSEFYVFNHIEANIVGKLIEKSVSDKIKKAFIIHLSAKRWKNDGKKDKHRKLQIPYQMPSYDSLKMRFDYNNKNMIRDEFACFDLLHQLISFESYERFYKKTTVVWLKCYIGKLMINGRKSSEKHDIDY